MEKITTDISTFENLRKGGYVYVDKTDTLWRLVANQEGRQFFIARPRFSKANNNETTKENETQKGSAECRVLSA